MACLSHRTPWLRHPFVAKSEEDFHLGVYPLGLLSYENGDEDIRPIANNTIPGEDIKSIAVEESGKVWLSAHALGGYNSGVSSYSDGVTNTDNGLSLLLLFSLLSSSFVLLLVFFPFISITQGHSTSSYT